MDKNSKIYIAGHDGLVGSALIRELLKGGYSNIVHKGYRQLDLRRQSETENFFASEKPEYVFLAAAKVGGILANSTYTAEFIYDNLMIATNVIHASYEYGVKKLLNLGSSCIYPKLASQPLKEASLLTDVLEPTNEPYAIAKIAAIKLCRYYNEQYETNFISVMPTNLYGPNDNYDLETSHVLPALIRKFYLAKYLSEDDFERIVKDLRRNGNEPDSLDKETIERHLLMYGIKKNKVVLWGTGKVYREFLHVDDLVSASIFLMKEYNASDIGEFINVGIGEDLTIKELAEIIKGVVGFTGEIEWDPTKPDGTPKKLLDVSRIATLGWKSEISLEEGIKRSYEWYDGRSK